ncbi:MAG TPA: SAM-dependent methyltransferase [Paenibacillus sp.]|uniref:class I SAM-dependent methyltransferase n=1 Tax=Paenibacillus TaxID=44249 RepID=UPI000B9FF9DD|nr:MULTISPECIES: class I SAM-dependent methyltransferase [Paenibacillus]OZQ64791.1 SAM-dependent methyltransferase [Paenibacillus taichungensis]HBU81048.1 SAM-dependent methyltransferase [Paenibacillus sp.]
MKQNESSITSLISAFGRAYHCQYDTPLIFDDYIAKELITPQEFSDIRENMIQGIHFFNPEMAHQCKNDSDKILKWITQVQLSPITLARAAYCEHVLLHEVTLGLKQVVILGAGMDTFALRHPELEDTLELFEVDYPATQQFKKERLHQAKLNIPGNLHFVPMDFTRKPSYEGLTNGGLEKLKTLVTLLGVSYYLTKKDLSNLIEHVFANLPIGSSIVLDYADEHLFEEKGRFNRVENMVKMAAMGGEPMQSCFTYEEMERLLADVGLLIYENLSPEDIQDRYFSNRTDDLSAFETNHFIHAVKK